MKLQLKLAIYNALSKALVVLAFGALMPFIVEKVVYNHIDQRLKARTSKVLRIIEKGGLNDIARESDCTFESYNILKEEFILIEPLSGMKDVKPTVITNEEWEIDGEKLNHRIIRQSFIYDNQIYSLQIGEGIDSLNKLKNTISKVALWATILTIIVSIFVDVGYARLLLRPLNEIVERKLKGTKDPVHFNDVPVETSTLEFQQLDISITELMQRIKAAFMTEKEFISNVSHELQTPISILKTRFENMLMDEKIDDDVADKLDDSIRKLNRMSKIIKSLLMISKIDNEQFLKNETVNIKALLQEIAEDFQEHLSTKNIRLYMQHLDEFEIQNANRTLLYTLFSNIITNAIKYNVENGQIDISATKQSNVFVVAIRDTGVGIAKENLTHIFDRFKKFNKSTEPSFGLGLAIVKTISDFHRLNLHVESEANKGTTFRVEFPIEPFT
ncbi:MAG TPA: HAMP domain-containing sensor histidine kinase [Bacteroidia bacterium]|nr:HAMP domain-containing histidine kinase [Bacteroidia bacterium]QQR95295.1 MAG: HAMP domain-containing histidine kinase [Bacteroidota bacterium]MBP7715597.1 HAMP domain-containing histidine kinase [Bacteroidia bacterium]MBP8668781.1 HAMP domain-containing histidine kinase [Bacteroidia bacterium]HOZ82822.1 HAMP domain-containing sensor histidine kinase [Bacteroidia bacterium]